MLKPEPCQMCLDEFDFGIYRVNYKSTVSHLADPYKCLFATMLRWIVFLLLVWLSLSCLYCISRQAKPGWVGLIHRLSTLALATLRWRRLAAKYWFHSLFSSFLFPSARPAQLSSAQLIIFIICNHFASSANNLFNSTTNVNGWMDGWMHDGFCRVSGSGRRIY